MSRNLLGLFGKSQQVPMKQIKVSPVKIREVKKDKDSFICLCESVKKDGVGKDIHLNLATDEEGKIIKNMYVVVDGGNRFEANRLAQHPDIVAKIPSRLLTETECRVLQMILNKTSTTQTRGEEAAQLALILSENKNLTLAELVDITTIPAPQIDMITNLSRLIPEAKEALEKGNLTVSSANELGRCKVPGMQKALLDEHMSLPTDEFINKCQEARKANKVGKPIPKGMSTKYRNKNEVDQRYEELQHKMETTTGQEVHLTYEDHLTEMKELMDWILSMDPESVLKRESKKSKKSEKRDVKAELEAAKVEIAALKAGS